MKRRKFKVRPVDMCIYIDKHIYEPNHDVDTIFDYLQNLFYSLSIKQRFFNCEEHYEQYALYCATQAYIRLTNPKQFLPDDDPHKVPKIKSVLNWIKSVMYGFKVDFQKLNFNFIHWDGEDEEINKNIKEDMESQARELSSTTLSTEVECYFSSLPSTIKEFLKSTPYSNDKVILHNLYMSCLMTLLRGVTLSNVNKKKISKFDKFCNDKALESIYYEESLNSPVVWNLPEEFKSYVYVLNNKIKDLVVKDIRELIRYSESSQEIIECMLLSPYAIEEDKEDNE